MLDTMSGRARVDVVAEAVRERICLSDPTGEMVLHEGALATEFGMSRTPVRQVLQRLAYERLVETKSGVGTIAVPLNEADRAGYARVHHAILRAIMDCEPADLTIRQKSDIVALASVVKQEASTGIEFHFTVRSRLLELLGSVVRDPILFDAHLASHWRVIRCEIGWDYRHHPTRTAQRLSTLVSALAAAVEAGKGSLFEALIDHDPQA